MAAKKNTDAGNVTAPKALLVAILAAMASGPFAAYAATVNPEAMTEAQIASTVSAIRALDPPLVQRAEASLTPQKAPTDAANALLAQMRAQGTNVAPTGTVAQTAAPVADALAAFRGKGAGKGAARPKNDRTAGIPVGGIIARQNKTGSYYHAVRVADGWRVLEATGIGADGTINVTAVGPVVPSWWGGFDVPAPNRRFMHGEAVRLLAAGHAVAFPSPLKGAIVMEVRNPAK